MNDTPEGAAIADGDAVRADRIPAAVTAAELLYEDGSTQTFTLDGKTVFIENGRPTDGEWYVDAAGRFGSFWPPSYRASYDLLWIVENNEVVGLRFIDGQNGATSNGRYRRG